MSPRRAGRARGFTMIELLITLTALGVVMLVMMTIIFATSRNKTGTMNRLESVQAARVAVDMMARDLRSAGYGADITWTAPQPAIAYIDSEEVILCADFDPYPDSIGVGRHGTPAAYDPAGNPQPHPLVGTSWTPPRKYRTGAELVRWTLDVNNDGQVDSGDQSDPNGADAAATRNPNDYVLVRQVYGDSTGGVAGNNGGTMQHVALVQHPGGANPPLFLVYLRGSTSPWNWSNGPIPAASLPDIQRLVIQVTAASTKPDSRGLYSTTTLTAQVNSMRNTPDFGAPQYTVDGYVFNDSLVHNGVKDTGEPGLVGVSVRVGPSYTGTTDANGHFLIRVPAGTYAVRHTVPSGYTVYTHPDSFTVTIPPSATCSFADMPLAGSHLNLYAFNDTDLDGIHDAGEAMLSSVLMTVTPGGTTGVTDGSGHLRVFVTPGAFTVTATLPDSFNATSTNPVSGTVASGDSVAVWFGMAKSVAAQTGTITGTVYVDANGNGNFDSGESGKQGVWVGVSPDSGVTVKAYATTDANGRFSMTVPANSPPGTAPYFVYIVPPSGFYATTSTSLGPVLISGGQTLSNYNFGVSGFRVIQLSAQRVLCLASGDLIEKDWPGNATSKRRGDADLVLGADASGTDQISVWFNQYDSATLFNNARDYNRTAAQAVLCLSVDTLDTGAANLQELRNDVVTGTKCAAAGNFFVWLNQNSSGNEGFLPATPTRSYKTTDQGDVQALITGDMCGTASTGDPDDILVGTKSPYPGVGSLELWQSSGGSSPTYTRIETYPTDATYTVGEVTGIARGDLDGDGKADLVVTTRTTAGTYTGQILIFKFMGKTVSPRFKFENQFTLSTRQPTCVALTDVDGDGYPDIVCGTISSANTGELRYYHNDNPSQFSFGHKRTVSAPGPVQCLSVGDFGGISRADIAVGWRQDTAGYVGGISIYYTDSGTIPTTGVDPSGGLAVNWCAALTANHFNYGIYPAYSGPMLMDLAAGVKSSSTDAAIWLFIR